MTRNCRDLRALVSGSTLLLFLGLLSCNDAKVFEPDCDGCFQYHVTGPSSGTDELLRDIFFVDSANGWTVGNDGTILHSEDGGLTWATQHQGAGGRLWGVHFVDADLGWVVGEDDSLYRTFNGGGSWIPRPTVGFNLTAIHMIDQRRGFAVGEDIILETNNSGTSWQVYTDQDWELPFLYGVTFVDPNKGWAVGNGENEIIATTNGGARWFPQPNHPPTPPLKDVAFFDGARGWAVGVGGTIVHTADGGATWLKQTIGTDRVLHGVDFWDAETGAVVGDSGVVFTTTDAGATWEQRLAGNNNDLMKVSYLDASTFVVCGANGSLVRFTYSWDDCCD